MGWLERELDGLVPVQFGLNPTHDLTHPGSFTTMRRPLENKREGWRERGKEWVL